MHVPGRPRNHRCLARPSSRVLAALLGVVFVLSSLIGLVHEATTSHVRCAEHGELIHGAPGTAATATTHATIERGHGLPGESRGHEHCQLTYGAHDSRCAPRPPVIATAPAIAFEPAAPPQHVVHARGTTLYRTAPKTSPPA